MKWIYIRNGQTYNSLPEMMENEVHAEIKHAHSVGGGAMMNMPLIIDGKEYPGPVHVEYAEIINIGFGTQYDMTDIWFNLPPFQQINV